MDELSRIYKMIIIEIVVFNCLCKCYFFYYINVELVEYFLWFFLFVFLGLVQIEFKDNFVLEFENYIIVYC